MKLTPILKTFTPYNIPPRSINWYPGHMAKGLKRIEAMLSELDVLLEIRDARLPLSTTNIQFENLFQNYLKNNKDKSSSVKRILLFNKADLINNEDKLLIKKHYLSKLKDPSFFLSAEYSSTKELSKILKFISKDTLNQPMKYPFLKVMVIGMPNVGKSSIINALRRGGVGKGKVMATGGMPGLTKSVGATVRVWDEPPIYLVDSPGILLPHIPDPLIALKLAVIGSINPTLTDPYLLCDYLLHHYKYNYLSNNSNPFNLPNQNQLPDTVIELLNLIAKRYGHLNIGGKYNLDQAAITFLTKFRKGDYPPTLLDEITTTNIEKWFNYLKILKSGIKTGMNLEELNNFGLIQSKNQMKKLQKLQYMEKVIKKKELMPKPKF